MKNWLLAFRPKTLTAAIVPVVVATALVHAEDLPLKWWVTFFAIVSSLFIQIGTNLINDAIDFRKGADDEKRIGPKRMTQSGLLSSRWVMGGGLFCFALAAAFGLPLVIEGGWPIVWIGMASLFCGYAYTGGPFPLAYRGFGDLFVLIFFGWIAVMGTYYLQTKNIDIAPLIAGTQIGCLATVLIAINNLRDAPLDARVHKKTLAVRFGPRFARFEILLLSFLPFALGAYWWLLGRKEAALLPLLLLPLAFRLVLAIFREPPSALYNRFLAQSAALHLLFGILLAVGLSWK